MGQRRSGKVSSTVNITISILVALGAIAYFSSSRSAKPQTGESLRLNSATAPKSPTDQRAVAPAPVPPAPTEPRGAPSATLGTAANQRATVTEPPKTQAEAFAATLQAANPDLPDDLKRQLAAPPPELPPDLKAQLHAPPPEIPEDLKRQMAIPPRTVTIDEVNNPR